MFVRANFVDIYLQGMRERSMRSGAELAREIKLTDWSMAGNLSNRSSGVQIPRDICTRLKRYLYSEKCSWIIKVNIWKFIYLNCGEWYEDMIDRRSYTHNLSSCETKAWKKSGLQRNSNPWPPRYRCVALPTELWSHTLGARSIYWVHISREEWNDVKFIWNNSYLYCGCRWKWNVIIAVNFPI